MKVLSIDSVHALGRNQYTEDVHRRGCSAIGASQIPAMGNNGQKAYRTTGLNPGGLQSYQIKNSWALVIYCCWTSYNSHTLSLRACLTDFTCMRLGNWIVFKSDFSSWSLETITPAWNGADRFRVFNFVGFFFCVRCVLEMLLPALTLPLSHT